MRKGGLSIVMGLSLNLPWFVDGEATNSVLTAPAQRGRGEVSGQGAHEREAICCLLPVVLYPWQGCPGLHMDLDWRRGHRR